MKRADYNRRINEIVARLSELSEEDRAIIQDRRSEPVVISLQQLFDYGKRYEERTKLHDELRAFASEQPED